MEETPPGEVIRALLDEPVSTARRKVLEQHAGRLHSLSPVRRASARWLADAGQGWQQPCPPCRRPGRTEGARTSQSTEAKPAQPGITEANAAVQQRFPFEDTRDLEDARRGFLGTAAESVVKDGDGRVVWDLGTYGFLDRDCPATADPSLWRQSRLCSDHGLFEVTEGIYQVRGFDLSNMTVVEGERGVLVIDPLLCAETAAAALARYRAHRGERPVSAVLYTLSHADHFGGVPGVITDEDVAAGVPVFAPHGFLRYAVSENVYAGTAMSRRAASMYGVALPKGERGQIGAGLGQGVVELEAEGAAGVKAVRTGPTSKRVPFGAQDGPAAPSHGRSPAAPPGRRRVV